MVKFNKYIIIILVLVLAFSIKNNIDARNQLNSDYDFYIHNINVSLDNMEYKVNENEFDLRFYDYIYYANQDIKALESLKDNLNKNQLENIQLIQESISHYYRLFKDKLQ